MLGEGRVLPYEWHAPNDPFKQNTARLIRVIKKVQDGPVWSKKPAKGHGVGFASHYSFYSYVAMAVEASLVDGKVRVHKVDCAVDCGKIVNPDTVKAQIEGGIIFGLSGALHGKITLTDGKVDQSNFHDYLVLRHNEAPEINVMLIDNDETPTGIGEPGVPPVAPAVCAADFAATGKRVRNLPIASTNFSKA
jgi:CO/xanthine dehydrogenase Mo-binding subunit